jgi:hypothetical protein
VNYYAYLFNNLQTWFYKIIDTYHSRFILAEASHIDGSNGYYANSHVIGIGDRAVFVGAIDIFVRNAYVLPKLLSYE